MFDHGGMATAAALDLDADRSGLADLAERVRPVELRSEQPTWPVVAGLESLLPGGLTRGTTVAVGAAPGVTGAVTLALAVAAGPSEAGAWTALVGEGGDVGGGSWGLVAAAGLGVALDRLIVVAPAGPPPSGWGPVLGALVDGFPVVVVGPGVRLRAADTRRLAARLRERGGVMVRVGGDGAVPAAAHVRLLVREGEWQGVEDGAGHLRARHVVVEATGRGAASRPRRAALLLPGPDGRVSGVGA